MNKTKLHLIKILYKLFNTFELRGNRAYASKKKYFNKDGNSFKDSKFVVGIVIERWGMHSQFVDACEELEISYCLIDLFRSDWLVELRKKEFSFLLIRPSVQYTPWKAMFDNRIAIIKKDFNIFPNPLSLWLWENKARTYEWLDYYNIPHPKTFVFYSRREAEKFTELGIYPLVYKANIGSGSSGVSIITNRQQLKQKIHQCFRRGIRTYRKHKLDKEHGYIILQTFLKDVQEWRIIRMGEFYFGFEKLKKGEFHSGSKEFGYGMPPEKVLNLVRDLTLEHDFKYVSIDVFFDQDENIYINEIQPYFGQENDRELLVIDGESGRLHFSDNKWNFEPGAFCMNNLANLRITEIIKRIG